MRKAAQIVGAAAVAAWLLTGCGSGGSKETPAKATSPEPSSPSQPGGADEKPSQGGDAALEGAWQAKTDGATITLVLFKGTASLGTGADSGTVCQGKTQEMMGATMVALKCTGKDTSRTMGTLKPGADGKSLKVSWRGGPTDDFTKADTKIKLPKMPDLPKVPGTN
ncbi:hypothetical protein [Streptomyces sp. MST-110588]|uniref:hypothetical protein n=1 Tax=Streptomyces sp. MST-110588 TaxID=2833628 RepID=UPI001F5DC8BC|nr:hypothetical protein [Streptomyces sp. MST-110588]UNO41285.1 hypothetical protein KGS77_19055 [Streptomyces sp. MST-110588]